MNVEGTRGIKRRKKTWLDEINGDMSSFADVCNDVVGNSVC